MLELNMIAGTRSGLDDPYSILISERTAETLFGTTDVTDEVLTLNEETEVIIRKN